MIVAAQIVDFVLTVGFRVSTVTANTHRGKEWLREHSATARYGQTKTILIDSYRVPKFVQEIEESGLTVSTITGGKK